MSLEIIVRTYKINIRPKAESELNWFKEQPTLTSAIEHAAMAENSEGKRYSHQRRLKKSNLEQAKSLLIENQSSIKHCKNFDELFLLLEGILRPIHGIGELYIYDTALRIGAKLNLLPSKVYLHAGTRSGARKLGFSGKEPSLEVSDFPKALQQLEPLEIEDVLCIFKDELDKDETNNFDEDINKRSWCS